MRKAELANKATGFLLPLPIFLDPGSNILIANSALTESQLALPASMAALPALLLLNSAHPKTLKSTGASFYNLFFLLYILAVVALAFYSASVSLKSLAYAAQWITPFIWFYYFLSFSNRNEIELFIKWFIRGTIVGSAYTTVAGILEILIYGSLLDAGRMSQNLILPGHYQLYVYIPTALAFNALISIAATKLNPINHNKRINLIIIFTTIPALVFTGAREGILVFTIGLIGMHLIRSIKAIASTAIAVSFLISAFFFNIDRIQNSEILQEVRLINKILNLREEGKEFGGRDEMAGLYLKVISESPYFGTAMLPPSTAIPKLNIEAPSAHNYYIDTLAWGGILLMTISIPFLGFITTKSIANIVKSIGSENVEKQFLATISMLALMFLFISNNLNVPLRQPLTGPIFVFFCYWLLVGNKIHSK